MKIGHHTPTPYFESSLHVEYCLLMAFLGVSISIRCRHKRVRNPHLTRMICAASRSQIPFLL